MKKALLLVQKEWNNYFPDDVEGCWLEPLYSKQTFLNRVVRKIILKFNLPLKEVLFRNWLKYAKEAEKIILFDTGNAPEVVRFLIKKYPKKRIIVWYWNPVAKSIHPQMFSGLKVELWSFDKKDCEQFGMKNNTQFYFPENVVRGITAAKGKVDVFYVGVDKNRGETLLELKAHLENMSLTYLFHVVKSAKSTQVHGLEYYKRIDYLKVIENIHNSRVILDLVQGIQTGITLRPIEAIYFKKKLITNMKEIKEFEFYNKNNVFIVGEDSWDSLRSFVETKFDDGENEKWVERYSLKAWMTRFDTV